MKISVIIPTYKPKDYFWECLDSLVQQTFSKDDFEVIIVLNGCCEPWKEGIETYMASKMKGMNINFIQTDVPGVSNARNVALDNAKGEYVTFIDDDDFVSPKFLQKLYEKTSSNTVSICYPFAFNDGNTNIQLPYRITDAYDYCVKNNKTTLNSKARKFFSGPWMKLIPMSIIQNRRFDVRFKNGEDSLFMFLISDRIKPLSFTSKEAVYYRRIRKGSANSNLSTYKKRIIHAKRMITEYCKIHSKGKYNKLFFLTRIVATLKVII